MRNLRIKGTDIYEGASPFMRFDKAVYADAWLMGYEEAVEDGVVSDMGLTHPDDQDWNEAYDAGRDFRIKEEGIEE